MFWKQIQFCEFEILPGPQKRVRWGVPDGRRDPATGDLVHDDLLISAALCAALEKKKWAVSYGRPTLSRPVTHWMIWTRVFDVDNSG